MIASLIPLPPAADEKLSKLEPVHMAMMSYRQTLAHYAEPHHTLVAELHDLMLHDTDADREIDVLVRPIVESWQSMHRVLEHYRAMRDVEGMA